MTSLLGHPNPKKTVPSKGQLLAVFGIKLTIPLTSFSILPFLNSMVAQATNKPPLKASDYIGRVPVIIIGMLGLSFTSLAFGTSTTIARIIFTRFFVGIFAGIVGVLHSIVGELASQEGWRTVFPFYDVMAALGLILGPLIGGNLVSPDVDTGIFKTYPFLLPCLVVALLSALSAGVAAFFLRETNVRKVEKPFLPDPEVEVSTTTPYRARDLLSIPSIRALCLASGAIGMLGSAFNYMVALVGYTQLGLSPSQIALALSIGGFVSICLKVSLPLILKRTTALRMFKITLIAWIPTFAGLGLLPLLSSSPVLLWIGMGIVLFLSRVACLAFSLKLILVRAHTPSTTALGAANGLTEFVENIGSLIGPAPLSTLYAASIKYNILGGYAWTIVALAVCIACRGTASGIEEEWAVETMDRERDRERME
ncbi:MFS general substrate transporter [Atractiella rhizophila]|nr:MFS general substrate transporter [Atractiella rhizophila]